MKPLESIVALLTAGKSLYHVILNDEEDKETILQMLTLFLGTVSLHLLVAYDIDQVDLEAALYCETEETA